MGAYAEQIAKLKLVELLKGSAGRDDISQTDVDQLHANVLKAADTAGRLLEAIPLTFRQYTEHNLTHSANLIRLMGKFIPEETQQNLNALELAVLIFSALLHDLGMFVTDRERTDFLESQDFRQFLNAVPEKDHAIAEAYAVGKNVTARVIEDAVMADYFRRLHPGRARQNIEQHDDLRKALQFREHSLVGDVAQLCESHGWGVYESTDPRQPEKTIQKLNPRKRIYDVRFNEHYMAAALRLADIMDFDRSRTPLALLKTIDFTEPKSQAEWQKHLQITGWDVSDRDVAFQAKCRKPEHYVAVMEFIDWIDAELRDCRRLLVRDAPKEIAERYHFHLQPAVDRIYVAMEDERFIAGAFRFELDYERIMKLLMDRSLYPDPSLFLRELLQNSLDACRVRMAIAQSEGAGDRYEPQIAVWDNTAEPNPTIVFQDNGVGMSRSVIENYFMRVGRSYYRSNEFHAERKRLMDKGAELEATSQFGIGFLSCFMVADRIEIETYRCGYAPLYLLVEGATKYFTMKLVDRPPHPEFRLQGEAIDADGPPAFPGTRVTLHLRPGAKVNVRQTLETFAVNVETPISIVKDGQIFKVPRYRWRGSPLQFLDRSIADAIEVWRSILVPLEVPLKEYGFCDGIDGKAWFWMLRAPDGSPTPRLNWIEVRNDSVDAVGLPASASQLRVNLLMSKVELDIKQPIPEALGVTEDLRRFWDEADFGMRQQLMRFCRGFGHGSWLKTDSLVEAVAKGSYSWMDSDAYFGQGPALQETQQFALHGIALPGGVTLWDPMRGQAEPARVLDFPAGFAIDLRKRVPTPAANRLFVAPHEAAEMGIALTRAFIRFAIELAEQHSGDTHWDRWVATFFGRVPAFFWWRHAVRAEYARIAGRLRFLVGRGDARVELSGEELRAKFGRYIPVHRREIDPDEGINAVLFSKYASRKREDGIVEYDLDTEAELPPIE